MSDAVAELKQAFTDFKALNDRRYEELKDGMPSAETLAAVDRANAAITAVQDRIEAAEKKAAEDRATIDEMEARLNRPLAGGVSRGQLSDEKIERYARWQSAVQKKPVDPAHVDLEFVNSYKAALDDYMLHGKDHASPDSMQILNSAVAGDNPSGGYYVEPDANGRLVNYIYETSPVRRLTSPQVASGDGLKGRVRLGEAGYGWVGETEARPNTATPLVFEWEIPLREMYANPDATQRILDQASVDIGGWLEGEVRATFARAEASAFVSGNGVKRPRGFITYAAGIPGDTKETWPRIEQVPSLSASSITPDGLLALEGALKEEYRRSAVYAMRRGTETLVRQLKDGTGNYLWQPDFSAAGKGTLNGYPVEIMADMPAVSGGATPVAFGDFSEAYQIADSPTGTRVLVDPYTNKPFIQFYTTRYVGGDVVNFEAIKLQTISES